MKKIFYSQSLTAEQFNGLVGMLGPDKAREFLTGTLKIEFEPFKNHHEFPDSEKFCAHDWTLGDLNALVKRIGIEKVKAILAGQLNFTFQRTSILRLISGSESLVINALNGSRLICEAIETFKGFIDINFIKLGINQPDIATPRTPVCVHEMIIKGSFMDIFNSLPGTWSEKCLSQNQVIEFCETLSKWLHPGDHATFFLVKKKDNKPIDENNPSSNLVVVYVSVYSGSLFVIVKCLKYNFVWSGECRHRVVSPQLMLSAT